MSVQSQISLLWLCCVGALIWVLPPATWEGADGMTFVVLLLAATAAAYGALVVRFVLGWAGRFVLGPDLA